MRRIFPYGAKGEGAVPGLVSRQRYLARRAEKKRAAKKRHRRNAALRKRELAEPILEFFYSEFPECFFREAPRLPLEVGIHKAVIERLPQFSPPLICAAIVLYTSDLLAYRASFRLGEARINLRGETVDTITAAAAEHAGKLLVENGHFEEAAIIARSLQSALIAA